MHYFQLLCKKEGEQIFYFFHYYLLFYFCAHENYVFKIAKIFFFFFLDKISVMIPFVSRLCQKCLKQNFFVKYTFVYMNPCEWLEVRSILFQMFICLDPKPLLPGFQFEICYSWIKHKLYLHSTCIQFWRKQTNQKKMLIWINLWIKILISFFCF